MHYYKYVLLNINSISFLISRNPLQSELLYHEIHHSIENLDKTTKIACPFCNKFFQKYSLRSHLRQHTNERQFSCKICSQTFTRNSNLKAHIKLLHMNAEGKKLNTEKISKKNDEKIEEKDEKENENEKKFSCTICDKKFTKR